MLAECEQATRDIQHWNKYRPEEPPVDCENFQVLAAGLRKSIAALDTGEKIDPAWLLTPEELKGITWPSR